MRLGMVFHSAVTVDEDDIAAQSFRSVVRDVDVMSAVAVDLSVTDIATERRVGKDQFPSSDVNPLRSEASPEPTHLRNSIEGLGAGEA